MNQMRPAKKLARAVALRDVALTVVSRTGRWERGSGVNLLTAQMGSLMISYRTPFQRLPARDGRLVAKAASLGLRLPQNLPYGLDIWAPKKVLNLEWDDRGAVTLVSFKSGVWEAELVATLECAPAK
jgi:hypothetical protein